MMNGKLVKAAELAKHFEVRPGTLRNWEKNAGFPKALKLGRSVRYDLGEVQQWEEQQRAARAA